MKLAPGLICPAKEYAYDSNLLDDMFCRTGMTLENFALGVSAYRRFPEARTLPLTERLLSSVSLGIAKRCKIMKVFGFSAPRSST